MTMTAGESAVCFSPELAPHFQAWGVGGKEGATERKHLGMKVPPAPQASPGAAR